MVRIFSVALLFFISTNYVYGSTETIKIYAGSGDGQAGVGTDEAQLTWAAARAY